MFLKCFLRKIGSMKSRKRSGQKQCVKMSSLCQRNTHLSSRHLLFMVVSFFESLSLFSPNLSLSLLTISLTLSLSLSLYLSLSLSRCISSIVPVFLCLSLQSLSLSQCLCLSHNLALSFYFSPTSLFQNYSLIQIQFSKI